MNRGKFITFEGGEGSGKSTQARLLAEALRAKGLDVVVTREPGGTPLGESIRELILANRPALDAEFLLFAAARAEHVVRKILPALQAGQWVVCDRYIDSTRVYQGKLAGVDARLIDVVELHTSRAAWPALTIVLDVPPATGRARASERGDLNRYDAEHLILSRPDPSGVSRHRPRGSRSLRRDRWLAARDRRRSGRLDRDVRPPRRRGLVWCLANTSIVCRSFDQVFAR